MPRRALLIVNRRSGSGGGDLAACLERLRSHALTVSEHVTERPAEVPKVIRARHGDIDFVILGGGDGTMSLAAEALVAHRLTLAILPFGTANDLARTLGIPADLMEACDVIADGHARLIDVGRVNERYFFNVASVGLGAAVPLHQAGERKRRWKVLGYLPSVIAAYRRTRAFRAEIDCDGERRRLRCLHLAVANGRHYGGGMTIAEDAGIDDGSLDVQVLKPQSLAALALLAPVLRWGLKGESERLVRLRGRRIVLHTLPAQPINADGELIAETPAEFRVLSQALRVIVPNPAAEEGGDRSAA